MLRKTSFRPRFFFVLLYLVLGACSTVRYEKTVDHVNLDRFFQKWYVIAGRFTSLETGAFNASETYAWNEKEKRIDIDFHFNQYAPAGELKSLPQKAWVEDTQTNARWKVQPFWPLKFDYLIIGLGKDYEWTAIGVPNEDYLWIMSPNPQMSDIRLALILQEVAATGYDVKKIVRVPQSLP